MKEYYIFKDGVQQGPFLSHQLSAQQITWQTMVWQSEIQAWVPAYQVESLHEVLNVVPPPLQTGKHTFIPNGNAAHSQYITATPLGAPPKRNRGTTIAIVSIIVATLLIAGGMLHGLPSITGDSYSAEIKRQNALIEEQNAKLAEYNKLEAHRQAEINERKQAEERKRRAKEIRVLNEQYDVVQAELRAEQEKLEDIESFHFLRTPQEKEEQVAAQQRIVKGKQMEVNVFKKALAKF
jgi:hypothetical protein